MSDTYKPDPRLLRETDPRFKHLIGKRVEFKDSKGERIVGVLDFAGINTVLHGKFQVTISRCPIWPVNPDTIKEYKP